MAAVRESLLRVAPLATNLDRLLSATRVSLREKDGDGKPKDQDRSRKHPRGSAHELECRECCDQIRGRHRRGSAGTVPTAGNAETSCNTPTRNTTELVGAEGLEPPTFAL
jgi:hypothetical protein